MPRGHLALACPPMLCTGLCTTSGSVRDRVWTVVWESGGRKKVRETYCGAMDRAIRNLSRAPDGGSGRGNPERPRDRSTGRPDNGGPPRPGSPGRGPGTFGSRVRGRRHGGTPSPLTRSHRPGCAGSPEQTRTPPSQWPRLGLPGRGRSTGAGAWTGSPALEPAPPWLTPHPLRRGTSKPHRGTRSRFGGTATRTRRKAPPRWSSRPHPWDTEPPRWHRDPHAEEGPTSVGPEAAPEIHPSGWLRQRLGGSPPRAPRTHTSRGPQPFGSSTATARHPHSTSPLPLTP
jgi:hypothetical protein